MSLRGHTATLGAKSGMEIGSIKNDRRWSHTNPLPLDSSRFTLKLPLGAQWGFQALAGLSFHRSC